MSAPRNPFKKPDAPGALPVERAISTAQPITETKTSYQTPNEPANTAAGSRGKNGPRIAVHYGGFEHVVDGLYKAELRMFVEGTKKKKPSESDVALRLMKLGKRYLDENGLDQLPDDL